MSIKRLAAAVALCVFSVVLPSTAFAKAPNLCVHYTHGNVHIEVGYCPNG
jgi:hypothetical protein